MAETARIGPKPLLRGLPDEILIWEVLVRLPPNALLRCRAVCRATSTRGFLLAHHGRQPTLPFISTYDYEQDSYHDILVLEPQPAVAAQSQLRPVARLESFFLFVEDSCDGLLVLSDAIWYLSICNPATRQHAHLDLLAGFFFMGMYPHGPTGEYRLLLHRPPFTMLVEHSIPGDRDACYVFSLGSNQLPRCIGCPGTAYGATPVLVGGSLHWYPQCHDDGREMISAFDTTEESFRWMRAPTVPDPGNAYLFEMDGRLGMYSYDDGAAVVDIWVLQDYESEVWALKRRVQLPAAQIRGQFVEGSDKTWNVVVMSQDSDVLVLISFGRWLLHIDIEGKLVARRWPKSEYRSRCAISAQTKPCSAYLLPGTRSL